MKYNPPTLETLKTQHGRIQEIRMAHLPHFRGLDVLALVITKRVGTIGFFLLIFFWTVSWLSWNVFAPVGLRFDPYPAFVLWLFISNMIQLFLLPLIMIGQNLEGKHSELRAERDLEINVKAEKEIEVILEHLENQQELMFKILKQLEEKDK